MRQKAFASQRFSAGNQTIVESNASGIRIRNMIVMNCGTPATQPAAKESAASPISPREGSIQSIVGRRIGVFCQHFGIELKVVHGHMSPAVGRTVDDFDEHLLPRVRCGVPRC